MPDKNFSRIRDDAGKRKFGEAPILGKVPRAPGTALREKEGKRVRGKRRKKLLTPFVMVWTCLLSFVTACVITVVIVAYFRTKAVAPAAGDLGSALSTDLELAFSDAPTPTTPAIGQEEALMIVKSALANRDPELIPDHFLLGEVSDPHEALRSLALIRRTEGEVTSLEWLGERYCNGGKLGEVVVVMNNGNRPGNRLAQLLACDDGKWRIDLDSFLRTVTPDWEQILSGGSGSSLVRVFVSADSYYNGIYADESLWRAYALASPDVADLLYGYAKRGSSQDKALGLIIASGEVFHRATLRISKDPESDARQFEISRVVAEDWVVADGDFDGAF